MNLDAVALHLFEMGAVKFGQFTLKSGATSPIYVDLRLTISQPKFLTALSESLHEAARDASYELICGVPYTALPFATAISIQHNIPMVLRRKEKKEYGTARQIEGIYEKGQRCLIVEDVVTSGGSVLETAESLQKEGLLVSDAVVLIDRGQGGRKHLAEKGIRLHAVCTISSLLEILTKKRKIDEQTAQAALHFLHHGA